MLSVNVLAVDPLDSRAIAKLDSSTRLTVMANPTRQDFLETLPESNVLICRSGVTVDEHALSGAKNYPQL